MKIYLYALQLSAGVCPISRRNTGLSCWAALGYLICYISVTYSPETLTIHLSTFLLAAGKKYMLNFLFLHGVVRLFPFDFLDSVMVV